jgi:hypothetical protein
VAADGCPPRLTPSDTPTSGVTLSETPTLTLPGDADTDAETPTVCTTPADTPAETPDDPDDPGDPVDTPADTVASGAADTPADTPDDPDEPDGDAAGAAGSPVPELPEPPDPDPEPEALGAGADAGAEAGADPEPPVVPVVPVVGGLEPPPEPDPDGAPLPGLALVLVPDPLGAEFGAVVAGRPVPSPVPPPADVPCEDRGREFPWPRGLAGPPAPRLVRGSTTGTDDPGGPPVKGPLASGAREPPPAGRCKIRTDTDIRTNSATRAPVTTVGTRLTAGCSRITPVMFLTARRVPSTPSATMSPGSGSAGPKPRLDSWRSLRKAALRCVPVKPGVRYTVVRPRPRLCRPERTAFPCSPDARSL